ncbi:GntR family transcriptional regulator [Acuticoccus sp. I52.16.1]|uniref:GntR family transcriptional regulator n=1 Tax=Acuticoccus sp. I52.16.1 TaxID=2928472 RepID=UPI001FD51B26|nr:GntR family transcriptional regulator [Acuticoccus sp. I52.16.1]UOM37284.1 GntR family transcriptional regulator [Acuticoccus sp. I52.16.1]
MADDGARGAGAPLYRQVEALLRAQIEAGKHPVGTALPPEQDLAAALRVSRATVRNAIRTLAEDGLVKPTPGVGTLVVRTRTPARRSTLLGLTEDPRLTGVPTRARTLHAELAAPSPAVRDKLALRHDERALHLVRLRDVAGAPFTVIRSYVPEWVGLTPKDDFSGAIYDLIERSRKLHITHGEDTVAARAATPGEAEALEIAPGTPVLTIRRTSFVEPDRPVEYAEAAIRSDLYEYNVTLTRTAR